MAVTFKDIDLLTQKSAPSGTEKIEVSDTQYITPNQIATLKRVHLEDESDLPASPDSETLYLIDDDGSGGSIPVISTDIEADKASNAKTASPKAVYDFVKPEMESSQPSGGMIPGIMYNLGTLSGAVTFSFASPSDSSIENEYKFTFDSGSTAADPTWPSGLLWVGNCLDANGEPEIAASKHYEVSVISGYGVIIEF